MAQRKARLSEVEIQVLDNEEPSPHRPGSSASTDAIDRLVPPSLEELESMNLPCLEDLHLEHAYTSLHSQIVRNVKDRMKLFHRENRRKSYHGCTERELQKEQGHELITECDKGRKRRKSSVDRRKRRSYRSKEKEYDTMTESDKSRRERRKNFEKHQRRKSYHEATERGKQKEYGVMDESGTVQQEYMDSYEILQRSRSCGSKPISSKQRDSNLAKESEIAQQEYEKSFVGQEADVQAEYKDWLDILTNKFTNEISFENKENNIGRKDTLTSSEYDYIRKDTLTGSPQDCSVLRLNTLENG